jgi:hypothetical protein
MEIIQPGDVISHTEMCLEEGVSLQRGMNFRLKGGRQLSLCHCVREHHILTGLRRMEKY